MSNRETCALSVCTVGPGNHAMKLPSRHMDRYTPFLMIPLVSHVYRFLFPMDHILMTILFQEQLLIPPKKQRTETRYVMLVQRTVDVKWDHRIVQTLGILPSHEDFVTHVHDRARAR
ncbi:hypothetical protein NPIL_225431 [Nephila pilipes]|uniref:Uncharacterized protein n=1 Tax=Nephila pilipes TaxID=299642 RepID=A0A8X6NSK2_NEPPI|nr:hypothetical protein NPIL_225431 [Nephila pilipes]